MSNNSLTPRAEMAITVMKDISSIASLLTCSFVTFLIILFKRYRYFNERLVLYMILSGIFASIGYLISHPTLVMHPQKIICAVEGWYLTLTDWNLLLWVCCLVVNLYFNAIQERITQKWEKFYCLVACGVPFIITVIPLPFAGWTIYGNAGSWCWITNHFGWRLGLWFVPVVSAGVLMLCLYLYVIIITRQRLSQWQNELDPHSQTRLMEYRKHVRPMLSYPCIYLLLISVPILNRVFEYSNEGNISFILALLQAVVSPSKGFCNAIAYAIHRDLFSKLSCFEMRNAFRAYRLGNKVEDYEVIEDNAIN